MITRLTRRAAGAVWYAAVASCGVSAQGENLKVASRPSVVHLRVDDTVDDLLAHAAFPGFAGLLLPWEDRGYETTMRLKEIASLLPYHTHVDPAVVVSSLNRMIEDAAASIGSHGTARFGGAPLPRPATVVLLYTGHSDFAPSEPPTFVAVGDADGIAPPVLMERRVTALRRAGTDVEYHRYPGVGHGFGLGVGTSAEGWIADAIRFWEKHMGQRRVRRRTKRKKPAVTSRSLNGDGR